MVFTDLNIAFRKFLRSESISGAILIVCIIISLGIANSDTQHWFKNLLNTDIGFENQYVQLKYTLTSWVNEGLMAVFFLLVGLEIKRELTHGELASGRQAALPIVAALGGMIIPAVIYAIINKQTDTAPGWGIPMATDIAFAIAILTILGSRIPTSLKVFLTALAIVDDLGAIIVIAVFYTAQLHFIYLLLSAIVFIIQLLLNRYGVRRLYYYMGTGVLLWYFIHHAGIDATVAGVLTAVTIPAKEINHSSPLERLEIILSKPVNLFIVPVFALVNSNIHFENTMLQTFTSPLGLGIMAGLLLGKPVGIMLSSWLAVRLGIADLPQNTAWVQILGVGILGGIGFTMSIFIALLSFQDETHQLGAKFIILCSSVIAGACGYAVLRVFSSKNQPEVELN